MQRCDMRCKEEHALMRWLCFIRSFEMSRLQLTCTELSIVFFKIYYKFFVFSITTIYEETLFLLLQHYMSSRPCMYRTLTVFTRTWLRYIRVFAIANPFVVCLSFVTFVHPTQGVGTFGNMSPPFSTLAIFWPPCKILRMSSQGNDSVGGVKRKRGSKIKRWWTYRRLYLINGTVQYGLWYN